MTHKVPGPGLNVVPSNSASNPLPLSKIEGLQSDLPTEDKCGGLQGGSQVGRGSGSGPKFVPITGSSPPRNIESLQSELGPKGTPSPCSGLSLLSPANPETCCCICASESCETQGVCVCV